MSNRDGKRRPPRSPASRYDWPELKAAFIALGPTRTFAEITRRFGPSHVSVRKHAKEERWLDAAAEADRKRDAKLDRTALRTLEERNRRTLLLIDKAREHLASDQADDPKWSDLPPLVKLEQLIEGEATDRVSFAEVSQLALAISRGHDELVTRLVAEILPNGKRRLFVEAWRAGAALVLEESAAGLLALEAGES